jgi:hypothetical protein
LRSSFRRRWGLEHSLVKAKMYQVWLRGCLKRSFIWEMDLLWGEWKYQEEARCTILIKESMGYQGSAQGTTPTDYSTPFQTASQHSQPLLPIYLPLEKDHLILV